MDVHGGLKRLRSADVGRDGPVLRTKSVSHPFAGMTRIRFDGSGGYANLSRSIATPRRTRLRVTPGEADVKRAQAWLEKASDLRGISGETDLPAGVRSVKRGACLFSP